MKPWLFFLPKISKLTPFGTKYSISLILVVLLTYARTYLILLSKKSIYTKCKIPFLKVRCGLNLGPAKDESVKEIPVDKFLIPSNE